MAAINCTFQQDLNSSTIDDNSSSLIDTCDVNVGISEETYERIKFVLYQVVLPIIAVIGVIGNSMSLTILCASPMKYAFNVYLKALTMTDILLLSAALVRFIFSLLTNYDVGFETAEMDANVTFYIGILCGSAFQEISASFVSIISIERFVAVVFPLKVKSFLLDVHPKKVVAIAITLHILINIPIVVLLGVESRVDTLMNTTKYWIDERIRTPDAKLVRKYYLVVLAVAKFMIPLVIVFFSTTAILFSRKFKSRHSISIVRGGSTERDKMTLTLIAMATFFTLCTIPSIVVFFLSSSDKAREIRETRLLALLTDIIVILACFNSANNFVIYILASRKFRGLFVSRFFPCRRYRKKREQSPTQKAYVISYSNELSDIEISGLNEESTVRPNSSSIATVSDTMFSMT